MEQSLKHRVTLVFGRICSGKGSYRKDADKRIVVSDIVKHIISSNNRDALQNSLHLDSQIGTTLINAIYIASMANRDHVVVDGIRQVSIVDRVLNAYPDAELVVTKEFCLENNIDCVIIGEEYKDNKDKSNIITQLPPVEPSDGVRVNYYSTLSTFKKS